MHANAYDVATASELKCCCLNCTCTIEFFSLHPHIKCDYHSLLSHASTLANALYEKKKAKDAMHGLVFSGFCHHPTLFFTPHPSPHLRHNHSYPLYYPVCNSRSHLSSIAVNSVPIWNCCQIMLSKFCHVHPSRGD